MSPSLVFLSRLLNIFLLISGQQCLSDYNHFSTVSSNALSSDSHAIVSTSIAPRVTRSFTASNIESELNTLPAQHQINTPTFRHAKAIPSSATRTQAQTKSGLQLGVLSAVRQRALIEDVDDPFPSHPGLVHSSNSQAGSLAQRQLNQSPFATASANRLTFTSRLPTPTQAPIITIANAFSKSRLPVTTSTIPIDAKSASSKSPSSASTTMSSQPSVTASTKPQFSPQTPLQKFASLYKSSNRLAPLAISLTVALAFGSLVTLVSILKCMCHCKRFANKKDYPEGFPWAATFTPLERGENRRKRLLSHTASIISARNSITPSPPFPMGQLNPASRVNSYYVDYQLNDLRSPSDIDADYTFGATEDIEKHFEKDTSGFSDELPSSSSAVGSREHLSLELNPEGDKRGRCMTNEPGWSSESDLRKKS